MLFQESMAAAAERAPVFCAAAPIGARCNLNCTYCHYLEKAQRHPANHDFRMSDAVLERFIMQALDPKHGPPVVFRWQGGEPLLAGTIFFDRIMELQNRHAHGRPYSNVVETNGTLLNDAWAAFFLRHNWTVIVGIDGPGKLHDSLRADRAGAGTFRKVSRGLDTLRRHGVPFETCTMVHRHNAQRASELYTWLRDAGSRRLHFRPLVELRPSHEERAAGCGRAAPSTAARPRAEIEAGLTLDSVRAARMGEFYCTVFDAWLRDNDGRVPVDFIESAIAASGGGGQVACEFRADCTATQLVEHDGEVFPCEHYVYPQHKLGHLEAQDLHTISDGEPARAFHRQKPELSGTCQGCEWLDLCNGGCPRHRFVQSQEQEPEPGLSYLCPAYRRFFQHAATTLRQMSAEAAPAKEAPAKRKTSTARSAAR